GVRGWRGGSARTDRIPHAGILHAEPGTRIHARTAARPGVGRQCLRRRAYHRRAHPAPAQGTRGGIDVAPHPDRPWQRLPLLGAGVRGVTDKRAGWFLLGRVGATLLSGVLIGLLLGRVWAGVALALAAMLAWQLLNLYWLDYWLRDRSRRDPPDSSGLWGDVVARVVRLHRRKRFHKQRMLEVFRELRHSTAAMPDGVLILNTQWELLWFNRMATQLLNLQRKADLGIRIINLIRDPALMRYLEKQQFDEPLVIARGREPRVHLSFQVVPYSGTQRLMLVLDVSHRVALESMRKDFVANASHELRSPLTVVTGYLETLLQDDALDPSLRAPLTEMQRQTQRMNGLV